jgi:hypothetical protein
LFVRGPFGLERDFDMLQLSAEPLGFVLQLNYFLITLGDLLSVPCLKLVDTRLGLFVQTLGKSSDQVLNGLADSDATAEAGAFLFFQFLEIAVDGGLRAGIAGSARTSMDGCLPCANSVSRAFLTSDL